MSAMNLRGLDVRVDRWDSLVESEQDRRVELSRIRWLGPLLVVPLLAVFLLWIGQDPALRTATLEAIVSPVPAAPTIPLEMNPRVERWVTAFETTRREEFDAMLRQREVYADMIRGKLRDRGMPEGLLYLAMIESGFSPLAVSRVSAVGIWQFMGPTAQQYGLRVDAYVDERKDPIAATDAALDYLAWLHDRFGGSWYLAAAAFNAGPGRMERILNRHADGRFSVEESYWDVLEYLPRETREYVPKMIAVTMLANDADALGFDASDVLPYRYENVFVPGGTTLQSVAATLDIGVTDLVALNPHLLKGVTPPFEIYGVRIPVGGSAQVIAGMSGKLPARLADDD
ncbi:MAG: lytic transglycosylase domain-containing protein [Longimicrobiales bacterium]|nr:lytic transglycosylase domain-containing protein [Longimicrobiales bacterium]